MTNEADLPVEQLIPLAWDSETFLIGTEHGVVPPGVCWSFAWREDDGEIKTNLVGNSPADEPEEALRAVLSSKRHRLITHNGGYDYAVVCRTFPDLIPLVFEAVCSGRATDTLWREKLINLSTTGKLDMMTLPDGSSQKIGYSLAALVLGYLRLDISALKEGSEDIWRLNFDQLDGWEASDYPDEAADYAVEDAVYTLQVYEHQEERKLRSGASTETEAFQLASSFVLMLMTAWGMKVNASAVEAMEREVNALLSDENMDLLLQAGILEPEQPSKPMMRNGKPVIARTGPDAGKPKMTKAKAAKINTKPLQEHVAALFQQLGEIPDLTDSGAIKLDAEVQAHLADVCPVMAQYQLRKSLQKLTTNQLPAFRMALETSGVMHFSYDVLKETGRTSSYDGGKARKGGELGEDGKPKRLFPGTNGQQVPNEISKKRKDPETGREEVEWSFDPRRNYEPREGTVFFDVDYTALELACVGQITHELFGHSVHLQRYNEGFDLHAYLASQLALRSDVGMAGEFAQACRAEGILSDPVQSYDAFLGCKNNEDAEVAKFFKHYRNFAKPVGLGFPGGLGAATMVDFARKTYNVLMTEDEARAFKEMWLEVYPEMPLYFEWMNGQTDPDNMGKDGESLYVYETPLGMVRRGASFCAAANGKCMQSPGAEGAKMAMIRVSRECYDPTMGSVLLGCRPIAFVHDQVIGETTTERSIWHEQAMRVRDIMCESMELVLPEIRMRSDEALLTAVWSKSAVPVRDEHGRLTPWRPAA